MLFRSYLNYSSEGQPVSYTYGAGVDLISGAAVQQSATLQVQPWDMAIVEEK